MKFADVNINVKGKIIFLTFFTVFLYTMLIAFIGYKEYHKVKSTTENYALLQARTHLEKDIMYRNWATVHGGVYVPLTSETPSNKYLELPHRDIETDFGQKLTLMNPAYMTRQVYELSENENQIKGHITSLNPHRPGNSPDEWEISALKKLEKGNSTVFEFGFDDGKEVLKFMGAFYTKPGCLKCHGYQGYKVGDVRGGITITLPMKEFRLAEKAQIKNFLLNHLIIWIIGVSIILFGGTKLKNSWGKVFQTETKFSSMVSSLQDGIVLINNEKKISLINESALKIFEKSETDSIGKEINNLHNFILTSDGLEISFENHPANKTAETGENIYGFEFGFKLNENVIKWVSVNTQKLEFNDKENIYSVLMTIHDITKNKNIEKDLAKYRDHLEDEVKRQTEELKTVNKQLENEIKKQRLAEERIKNALIKEKELNELKTRFISTASHEFRTPLTVILTSAEILEMFGKDETDEQYFKSLNNIINSVDNLTELMNDVLIYNKNESEKIKYTPKNIKLDEIIEEVVEKHNSSLKEGQIIKFLKNLNREKFYLDEKQIKYILDNLISNAIKYSPVHSEINITAVEEKNILKISVRDEGIGISEYDKNHLFEPFYRGEKTQNTKGTGLGLSIVKRAIELHHGKIEFINKNPGAEFIVSLPLELD